jgi:hypothetical protein
VGQWAELIGGTLLNGCTSGREWSLQEVMFSLPHWAVRAGRGQASGAAGFSPVILIDREVISHVDLVA